MIPNSEDDSGAHNNRSHNIIADDNRSNNNITHNSRSHNNIADDNRSNHHRANHPSHNRLGYVTIYLRKH